MYKSFLILLSACIMSCSQGGKEKTEDDTIVNSSETFYYGADLSYVNEMIDCGAVYKNDEEITEDPYKIFKDQGANLVRVRLWNNPSWTQYSNYDDVKKTIAKAKQNGMKVLLDFHYSDTWADPNKQEIPAAWLNVIDNKEVLGDSIYKYTYKTLSNLSKDGLMPEMVQVGNEINAMILQKGENLEPIDWSRNSFLINKGIEAVRAVSKDIEVMLHIAQPENALWWFKEASENGVIDYDWIGLSYYPLWSTYKFDKVSEALSTLIKTYNKKLMVVETAYPFTLENIDEANNILDSNALINGYPATQQGQLNYLNDLKDIIEKAGGLGLIYWEPAWVSTDCNTLWGKGSHWDNATLFDHNGNPTLGMQFYNSNIE
ncbi:MAG: glycosyl hydrolase 53 family protein [Flavobacteriaceae bacterium]|nr:glycosyl hydrolase 53 family protein [Flavobacteriaceae bacterium]